MWCATDLYNVKTAQKLTVGIQLRERGPIRELLQTRTDGRIRQNVKRSVAHAMLRQKRNHLPVDRVRVGEFESVQVDQGNISIKIYTEKSHTEAVQEHPS